MRHIVLTVEDDVFEEYASRKKKLAEKSWESFFWRVYNADQRRKRRFVK